MRYFWIKYVERTLHDGEPEVMVTKRNLFYIADHPDTARRRWEREMMAKFTGQPRDAFQFVAIKEIYPRNTYLPDNEHVEASRPNSASNPAYPDEDGSLLVSWIKSWFS